MADWFKFYENDLDETRLQYAISKLPEVIPVWVGILSEACRHKSGIVSWGKDEIELFGFSRRLGVSVPKVNEAVNILCEIRYITRSDDKITVIKWGEKQSEYCQKLTKRQNQSGDHNPNKPNGVPIVSRQCPDNVGQEERRGEEKRIDNKGGGEFLILQARLTAMYGRAVTARMSYAEESSLAEVSRRSGVLDELAELERFKGEPDSYFPQSLTKLVIGWQETLDRARNKAKPAKKKKGWIQDATYDASKGPQ